VYVASESVVLSLRYLNLNIFNFSTGTCNSFLVKIYYNYNHSRQTSSMQFIKNYVKTEFDLRKWGFSQLNYFFSIENLA